MPTAAVEAVSLNLLPPNQPFPFVKILKDELEKLRNNANVMFSGNWCLKTNSARRSLQIQRHPHFSFDETLAITFKQSVFQRTATRIT